MAIGLNYKFKPFKYNFGFIILIRDKFNLAPQKSQPATI